MLRIETLHHASLPVTDRLVNRRLLLLLLVSATPLAAQRGRDKASDWLADCQGNRWNRDRDQACEVREVTLPARTRVVVDGGQNGGIAVYGWDRNEIKVVARMQAQARNTGDARDILKDVKIVTASDIRAEGPSMRRRDNDESWSVSFDVYVPRKTSLDLETHNGGIGIEDVEGDIRFDAVNGGVRLAGLAGDVRGATQNGGLQVSLDGDKWSGRGLDVRTQNGGVRMDVPARYNAELETGTVNGHFDLDFPVTVRGRLGRTITTTLGSGGPPIRVMTTNGGVSLRRS